jgi:hypothetical protein
LAESGASGQTAVTEEDVRRFKFPKIPFEDLECIINEIDKTRQEIAKERQLLLEKESQAWKQFFSGMVNYPRLKQGT